MLAIRQSGPDESSYLPAPHQFREVALFSYGFRGGRLLICHLPP